MNKLFEELEIKNEIKTAIKELGFSELTDIQQLAIPIMIEGKDFIAQAQTGTGKTFAFAIPIIEKLTVKNKNTQALILCPTRELSLQVYNEVLKLLKHSSRVNVAAIVGGESYEKQFAKLAKKPHIIVGTPGRIIDHIKRDTIDFSFLDIITFDEADEMLKMGFKEDIEFILEKTNDDHQTVLFSATIPQEIKEIAKKYQKNAEIIKVDSKNLTVDAIEQFYYVVKKQDKLKLLIRVLDEQMTSSGIIFANTKKEVEEIAEVLRNSKYSANSLHGDLKQSQRNFVTNQFRNKELKILVATDVAARGLDISNVELVINYELPHENEVYVHRIGRTGRAGNKGKAYSFLTPRTEIKVSDLEKFTKSKIARLEIPSIKKIKRNRIEMFVNNIALDIEKNDVNHEDIITDLMSRGFDKDQIISALINKDYPSENAYEDIDFIPVNAAKSKREMGVRRGFQVFKINLGRNEKTTPVFLLELLTNKFNIYSKSVGDIKIFDKYTTLQISENVVDKIKRNSNIKIKNKIIKIEKA